MRENKTCREENLRHMSIEQLDALLQDKLQEKAPDAEVVLPILKELEEREQDQPTEITENISAAWKKFKKKTAPQKPTRQRSWIVGVAAAVAVVFLVIAAVPQTVGAESIFDVLVRWTSSVFEFFDPNKDEKLPQVDDGFVTKNPGLQQVYDKMTELGVTEPIVPQWLPDGFELTELKVTPMPDGQKVVAKLNNGTKGVVLSYWICTETVPAKFEKEDTDIEVYECVAVNHFIMDNEGNVTATWTKDNIECSITTDLDKDTVVKMIKSIYGREMP